MLGFGFQMLIQKVLAWQKGHPGLGGVIAL